jgi:hypothetical protein
VLVPPPPERAAQLLAFVHAETLTTPVNVTDPADVAAYREVFRRLQDAAVTGQDARQLIAEASRSLLAHHRQDAELAR